MPEENDKNKAASGRTIISAGAGIGAAIADYYLSTKSFLKSNISAALFPDVFGSNDKALTHGENVEKALKDEKTVLGAAYKRTIESTEGAKLYQQFTVAPTGMLSSDGNVELEERFAKAIAAEVPVIEKFKLKNLHFSKGSLACIGVITLLTGFLVGYGAKFLMRPSKEEKSSKTL